MSTRRFHGFYGVWQWRSDYDVNRWLCTWIGPRDYCACLLLYCSTRVLANTNYGRATSRQRERMHLSFLEWAPSDREPFSEFSCTESYCQSLPGSLRQLGSRGATGLRSARIARQHGRLLNTYGGASMNSRAVILKCVLRKTTEFTAQ